MIFLDTCTERFMEADVESILQNEKGLEAEKEELEKKLNHVLQENDTLKAKLAGKQLASEW